MEKSGSGRCLEEYCSALAEGGADLSAVELIVRESDGHGGRQVSAVCTRETAAGVPMLSIPIAIAISAEALIGTVEHRDVVSACSFDSGAAVIIAWLMRQRFFSSAGMELYHIGEKTAKERVWESYVAHLPSTFDCVFHWNSAEYALLQGTNLYGALSGALEELRGVYNTVVVSGLCEKSSERWPLTECTWERWLWAHSAYVSRAFPFELLSHSGAIAHNHNGALAVGLFEKPRASSPCLLPLIDSCDHDSSVHVTWQVSEADQTVALVFDEVTRKGAAINNNYGSKFDEDLLLCYGFVEGRSCYPVKLTSGKRYLLRQSDPLPVDLVQELAVMLGATAEDFDDPDLGLEICDVLLQMLTPRLEALQVVIKPTNGECPARVRMAGIYRNGQRDVLVSALAAVRQKQRDCA